MPGAGRTARLFLQARSPRGRNGGGGGGAGAGGGGGGGRAARPRGAAAAGRGAANQRRESRVARRSAGGTPIVHAFRPGDIRAHAGSHSPALDGPARRRRALEAVGKVVTGTRARLLSGSA